MTTRGVTTVKDVDVRPLWSGGRHTIRLRLGGRDVDLTPDQADRLAGQLAAAVRLVQAHEAKTEGLR